MQYFPPRLQEAGQALRWAALSGHVPVMEWPEKWWLEDDPFRSGLGRFSEDMFVFMGGGCVMDHIHWHISPTGSIYLQSSKPNVG